MQKMEYLNGDGLARSSSFLERSPLPERFVECSADLSTLLGRLGTIAFTFHYPLIQYVSWADASGLFELMERRGAITISDACRETVLTEAGSDALLGVICALGLVTRNSAGQYALTREAREFCLRSSPYYISDQFRQHSKPLPRTYMVGQKNLLVRLKYAVQFHLPRLQYGSSLRLLNQHSRNLPACVAAVKTGEFDGLECLVDFAGGSGTFSIPLALENRVDRIILAELPQALKNIRPYLAEHALEQRIELLGMDAFELPWPLPECDGLFVGNFLHGFPDETCHRFCAEAFRHVVPGGKIWIHEMIWNPNKDGPLFTALWNAAIRNGPGRQRTAAELAAILERAGFVDPYVVPTSGVFALVAAHKPR